MTGSRAHILNRLRARLAGAGDEARQKAVAARLADPQPNIIPERARAQGEALIHQFTDRLKKNKSEVIACASQQDVPIAIMNWLAQKNLSPRLHHGSDRVLASLPWDQAPNIERVPSPDCNAATSLSRALAGVSETGTLVLHSGPENPTTLNFLPDTHIVMIDKKDILGPYEQTWVQLRQSCGKTPLPRMINWISGPSRTADIEQTIVLGAHGPKTLLVIITG